MKIRVNSSRMNVNYYCCNIVFVGKSIIFITSSYIEISFLLYVTDTVAKRNSCSLSTTEASPVEWFSSYIAVAVSEQRF